MVWRMFNFHYHYNSSVSDIFARNGTIIGNDTIDVMIKGCFGHFDSIACVRNGAMTMLVLLTAAMCIIKVCKLHINQHPTLHQYIIFYCATLECLLCAVHWIMSLYVQLDFMAQYLKLVQFLMASHFYWTLATRAIRKESLTSRVIGPFYGIALLYFTIAVILGCINVQPSWIECFQTYWLALSMAECVLVQLFMIAGVYITRRLNEISTLDSIRSAQKRDLWSLIIAFQVSSLVSLAYDVTLRTLGDLENGCSGVFNHAQEIFSPIFSTYVIVKYLLPIWAMLFVFHPVEVCTDGEDFVPAISDDGTYTSVFSPTYESSRHRYKPLFQPGADHGGTPDSDFGTSPTYFNAPPGTSSTAQLYGHRVASNLEPITEENSNEHSVVESDRRPILS